MNVRRNFPLFLLLALPLWATNKKRSAHVRASCLTTYELADVFMSRDEQGSVQIEVVVRGCRLDSESTERDLEEQHYQHQFGNDYRAARMLWAYAYHLVRQRLTREELTRLKAVTPR